VSATATAAPHEVARYFRSGEDTLLGIVTHPIGEARGVGVVLLEGGHYGDASGKNRFSTHLAWRLAALGFHSIRIDYRGVGDSTGVVEDWVLDDPFADDLLGAVGVLRAEGVGRLAVFAECFGARGALVAAERIAELEALYLVTLVLRDGGRREQSDARLAASFRTTDFLRRVGKIRHVGDARRRALYRTFIRAKLRYALQGARYRARGVRVAPWLSTQIVEGLEGVGRRGIPTFLLYGTSVWDEHAIDFEAVADELPAMRHASIDALVLDRMIAGLKTVQIQDDIIDMASEWFDRELRPQAPSSG
jgi:pimeloyl-ACP methyl ester carboxylesterase